jgi:hypothetical protein
VNQIFSKLTLGFLVLLSVCLASPKTFAQAFGRGRVNWETNFPMHCSLKGVAAGNGTFVAIGVTTILNSKDGKTWINRSSENSNIYANINFATETYSVDGDTITFALVTAPFPKFPSPSEIKTNPLALSSYSSLSPNLPKIRQGFRAITFGNGTFVIVGNGGGILTSHDGEHWAASTSGSSNILTGVVCGSSGFVAVGVKGTILTSADGSVWTQRNSGTDQTLFGVAYGNGTFVALGDNDTILTSGDGIAWSPIDISSDMMESIAFGNGIFMASSIYTGYPNLPEESRLQGSTQTMVSTDGKNWHEVRHPYPSEGRFGVAMSPGHSGGTTALTFGGGLFIATSAEGIFTSKDGNEWKPSGEVNGYKSYYNGAAFGNGIFVAVGTGEITGINNGRETWGMTVATSKDANTWTLSQTPTSRLLWGHGSKHKFIAIGAFGTELVSTNGEVWTTEDKISISGCVYGNQVLFYSGSRHMVLSSKDGIVWTRLLPSSSDQPTPIVTSNNQNVAVSQNGVVIELNGQTYKLNLTSNIGQSMEVQASTNLEIWETLTTITNSGGILNFVDPDAKNYPQRFYRLKLQ